MNLEYESYINGTFQSSPPEPLPRTFRINYQLLDKESRDWCVSNFQSKIWYPLEYAKKQRPDLTVELEIEPPKITVDVTSPDRLTLAAHIYISTPSIMLVEEQTKWEYLPDYLRNSYRFYMPIYEIGTSQPLEYVPGSPIMSKRLELITSSLENEVVRTLVKTESIAGYAYVCKHLTHRGG